jgi:hypothetical protein
MERCTALRIKKGGNLFVTLQLVDKKSVKRLRGYAAADGRGVPARGSAYGTGSARARLG